MLPISPLGMMGDWSFAKNNVFALTWDIFASTEKAHRFGFPDMVDSEEMVDRLSAAIERCKSCHDG